MTAAGRGLLLVPLLLLAQGAPAQAREWRVDPARSVIAAVVEQGGRAFEARFARFEAAVAFDPARPEAAAVTITVDTSSFASGDGQRDQIATSRAFLATGEHPRARYATRAVRPLGGDRYAVEAELELRGVARPVRHEATIAAGAGEARATGEVELARLDWGVGQGQVPGQEVGLVVTVRFDLLAAPAGGGG